MSDLDAYYASRQGSEIGVFCNDKARQVVVITYAISFFFVPYISFLSCHGDNDSLIGKIY
jgi:hypothetical protein